MGWILPKSISVEEKWSGQFILKVDAAHYNFVSTCQFICILLTLYVQRREDEQIIDMLLS